MYLGKLNEIITSSVSEARTEASFEENLSLLVESHVRLKDQVSLYHGQRSRSTNHTAPFERPKFPPKKKIF